MGKMLSTQLIYRENSGGRVDVPEIRPSALVNKTGAACYFLANM